MSINDAGKGDFPRPVNQQKYAENYDRIFGKDCGICPNSQGYFWDKDKVTGQMVKTTCLLCNGKGKVK